MRKLLVFVCCVVVCGVAQQSIRDIDWMNFGYPLSDVEEVPAEVHFMSSADRTETAYLRNGKYSPHCNDDIPSCPMVTFDSVSYGALTGIESTVAVVVLTYHSGGTAGWQYVYLFSFNSGKPRLIAWLRTGSRAAQGLREVSISRGDLRLAVNDPNKRQGDCCSEGTITTRYQWRAGSFAPIGSPVYKTDPPSFNCAKANTPVEHLICQDRELAFLDRQMADAYQRVLRGASAKRKEIIRQQQAKWLTEYNQTCNAPLSLAERRDCIDQHLNDRLMTIWK